ncbi:cell division protein FtsL [Bartonella ancashensis]|uniref:Cell division protein FtsL n=1 Tax=Bartonella ancashensis TaxID=1318743 RepID=A0A0M4L873_9HYPH|nr:hypothetical protein [Bartonella ancashensis]ALE03613.1 Cell division protein FtsL [Bartonella ancashensis]
MVVFRTLDIILVTIMICIAAFTYKVKYDSQKQINELHRIEHEIAEEKNALKLLRAEWAMITNPARMAKLAERYQQELGLEMIKPRQIVELEDIPIRSYDSIEELIKKYDFEDDMLSGGVNHDSSKNHVIRKSRQ